MESGEIAESDEHKISISKFFSWNGLHPSHGFCFFFRNLDYFEMAKRGWPRTFAELKLWLDRLRVDIILKVSRNAIEIGNAWVALPL